MTLSAEVRRITDPKDVHIVQSIHEQVWHDDYSAQCRAIAEALQNYPERLSVYVVYADGAPVSCARVSWLGPIHFAYLYGGCTLPAYQKRGFYSALVAVRAREAKTFPRCRCQTNESANSSETWVSIPHLLP